MARGLRDGAYETAIAALAAPRYTEFLLKMELWLGNGSWAAPARAADAPRAHDRAVRDFAFAVLQKRHRRFRKYGGRHAGLGESELHRLRILCKKVRYAAEFFRELFPRKPAKRYHERPVEIQETLGSLNDAVASRALVAELERHMAGTAPAAMPRAVGLVQGWQAACIDRDIRSIPGVWDRFGAVRPFWHKR